MNPTDTTEGPALLGRLSSELSQTLKNVKTREKQLKQELLDESESWAEWRARWQSSQKSLFEHINQSDDFLVRVTEAATEAESEVAEAQVSLQNWLERATTITVSE